MGYFKRLWEQMEQQEAEEAMEETGDLTPEADHRRVLQSLYIDPHRWTCTVPKALPKKDRHSWAWDVYYERILEYEDKGESLPPGVLSSCHLNNGKIVEYHDLNQTSPGNMREYTGGVQLGDTGDSGQVRESDKPEGTRDLEKFLREQQNDLWGDW